MTDVRALLPPTQEGRMIWYGRFAKTLTDFSQLVPVIIPDFDEHLMWGPCRWQSRDATSLPNKGDECLIVLDNRRRPWVVAWWPFV